MIIKGGSVGSVGYWSKHLTRDDTNTRAELKEVRGLLADDVGAALRQMEAVASGSRCEGDFMYQANINPRDHERLTEEQWQQAVDTLEKNLGLEGHQRIVVEHEKEGRVHRHVVWNRVDADTMRVADMSWNYYTHERTSRELEDRFDLARTKSLHGERRPDGRPERAPEMWEERAKERSGIDRDAMKAELTGLWHATDSGKAFQAAIEERGYMLARGDRRGFVVMDQAGTAHSLARRLDGVTTAQVRDRMADIERDGLPGVAEARAQQKARQHERELSAEPQTPAPARSAEADRKGGYRDTAHPEITHHAPTQRDRILREAPKQPEPARTSPRLGPADTRPSQAPAPAPSPGKAAEKVGLDVVDAGGKVLGKLGDVIGSLFGGGSAEPKQPEEHGHAAALRKMQEAQRAEAALYRMRDSMERGHRIRAEDLQNLTDNHRENLRAKGDDYLRGLIDRLDDDRRRERDEGRTRDR